MINESFVLGGPSQNTTLDAIRGADNAAVAAGVTVVLEHGEDAGLRRARSVPRQPTRM